MTQAPTDTDRKARRMRRIARVLALIWAVCCTVASVGLWLAAAYGCGEEMDSGECFGVLLLLGPLIVGFIYLLTWVPTAIAWRWETEGGVALVVTGGLCAPCLLCAIWTPVLRDLQQVALLSAFALLVFGPPLAAGFLLLASWRRSRSSEIPQASR